jgi:sugar lactone lactonase YvrE
VPTETTIAAQQIYELPGDAVFPESIGIDPATGDAYVGSLADGALYRLRRGGGVDLWLAPGQDGRGSVAGVKVDSAGRLWAAGGYEGTLWVYRLADRSLLTRLDVGEQPSCVNDIAFGPDGTAYVTDSFIPTLFRVDPGTLTMERWIDLAAQGLPWPDGLNLNGIVLTGDRRSLVCCQTNLGRFWRVEIETAQVKEVRLAGGPLEHADGLALTGSTLWVAVNARNQVALVDLADDGASGVVKATVTSLAFDFPTAVAVHGDRVLVVNAQLDKMSSEPRLPFTVAALDLGGMPAAR